MHQIATYECANLKELEEKTNELLKKYRLNNPQIISIGYNEESKHYECIIKYYATATE